MSKPSWPKLANDMRDEGYWFVVDRNLANASGQSGSWRQVSLAGPMKDSSEHVESLAADPVDALADLLAKCRERWPAKHKWDDLGLAELMVAGRERGWEPNVYWSRDLRSWCAHSSASTVPFIHADDPAIALRAAMKDREKRRP